MNTNYFDYSDIYREMKREMEQKHERLQEQMEHEKAIIEALGFSDRLMTENNQLQKEIDSLQEDLEKQKAEIESLRAQLQEKEVQLSEQRKLTTGMAKKSSEEDLLKAFRTYANRSKRKTADKRAFAKSAMLEIANANGLTLPEELAATIDSLDDEQGELQIVIEHAEDVIASGGVKNVKSV